jgi:hypothetical protein
MPLSSTVPWSDIYMGMSSLELDEKEQMDLQKVRDKAPHFPPRVPPAHTHSH